MQLTEQHRAYWRLNLALTFVLLAIWFAVTFVVSYYADALSFKFNGWPFYFYMAAQGALIIYVVIIWIYAKFMNNLDKAYSIEEGS